MEYKLRQLTQEQVKETRRIASVRIHEKGHPKNLNFPYNWWHYHYIMLLRTYLKFVAIQQIIRLFLAISEVMYNKGLSVWIG